MNADTRLSDTQLAILAGAAAREELAVLPTPKTLKARGGALIVVLNSLIDRGLIEETEASEADAPQWRRDEDGRRLGLQITRQGLAALGFEGGEDSDAEAEQNEARHASIDTAASADARGSTVGPMPAATTDRTVSTSPDPVGAVSGSGSPSLRAGSKGAQVLCLLRRDGGASIEEMMAASGWQAHSVRGFLSGALKKKLGLEVTSSRDESGNRRYRVV